MRRLFWQISATLDGFMEGPDRELDQTAGFHDPDFERYASEMLQSIGGMVLGRRTYDLFAGYWPTATDPDADRMNELPKTVFSRTLDRVDWRNARLARDVGEEVRRLKAEAGEELAVFGSADLASTLMRLGLIDEYRILITPFVLGAGTAMFRDVADRIQLRLKKATPWSSGTVALTYEPAANAAAKGDDS